MSRPAVGTSSHLPTMLQGKAELGVAAGVVLGGVFVLVEAARIDAPATSNALGPKFFPICIGALLLVCGLWLAADVVRGGHGDPDAGEDIDLDRRSDWVSVALVSGAFLLHAALIAPLGWPLAGALLFWGVAVALGSRHWVRDLAVSVVLALGVYAVFTHLLGVFLPGGLLEGVL
jgi:putative tricarboxylic transport membrane protein